MFFSLGVLAPFDFSGIVYDPLGSLADSVARLAAGGTGSADATPGRPDGFPAGASGRSSRPDDALMALWAAVEADLYRFAKDPGFTAAVDAAAREQPEEYRRFARLNELYRDLVKLLIPYGLAPRRWNAWLRGQEYRSILPGSLALYLEDFLCGCTSRPLAALSGILVRHGACIMMEQD
jgi:predicted Abi (CAAX) family protease